MGKKSQCCKHLKNGVCLFNLRQIQNHGVLCSESITLEIKQNRSRLRIETEQFSPRGHFSRLPTILYIIVTLKHSSSGKCLTMLPINIRLGQPEPAQHTQHLCAYWSEQGHGLNVQSRHTLNGANKFRVAQWNAVRLVEIFVKLATKQKSTIWSVAVSVDSRPHSVAIPSLFQCL